MEQEETGITASTAQADDISTNDVLVGKIAAPSCDIYGQHYGHISHTHPIADIISSTTKQDALMGRSLAGYNINSEDIKLNGREADEILSVLKLPPNPCVNDVILALCQRIVMLECALKGAQKINNKEDEDVI